MHTMKVRRLTRPVRIEGDPLFGFGKASVTLAPNRDPNDFNWYLDVRGEKIRLTPHTVEASRQRLCVRFGGTRYADVLEHLLPLRAYGFFGLTVESEGCLPYDGCSKTFFESVMPATTIKLMDVPHATVARKCSWIYPGLRGGQKAHTTILPRVDGRLELKVSVSYEGLGSRMETYTFPDDLALRPLSGRLAQGWPAWRKPLSAFGGTLGVWKHHGRVEWPQRGSEAKTLKAFVDHRALDLLGSLSLLMDGRWLSATVISHCSGHLADIEVCREAYGCLVGLGVAAHAS